MRHVAWGLFGLSGLILLGSIPLALSFWEVYGYPQSVSDWWNESWWVFAVAAVPALAGYLVLRIARDRENRGNGEDWPL